MTTCLFFRSEPAWLGFNPLPGWALQSKPRANEFARATHARDAKVMLVNELSRRFTQLTVAAAVYCVVFWRWKGQ